ncbi:TetR/AcrR family transcriptional regulator C-terminal domain-containing protein [Actinoplanes sp. LDG1-06]|uniref:TetR/AcrR family transcriptional regulator C-terminal domain-containing protein n=1 Tax=Paractinoplanes ovalisporus TaxID=2810368 RepID=A0ABS2ARP8_9ACTN|nr:TetR/AcrR family transcriptional regulator C-terminal domain-containing protein [Actinoplanes ovalisporus]MBM2622520.1 TetR/AcrR family transcriptional regulator C-terminal domain-containing protein [Actinoplanes ovalisporus]
MPQNQDSFISSVWLKPPRTQTGQPSLSREQIVRAAMEILDEEGTAGLSMRRLGTKLDAGATSLYWHVAHKDELLELVVDEVFGEVYVPEPGDTDWRIGASIVANGLRAALLRHTWVIALLGAHPTLGPNAMRVGERMIALFSAAGFTGFEVSHASSVLNAHAIGSATSQAAFMAAMKRTGKTPAEVADEVEPFLDRVAPDHPNYDKWRRETDQLHRDPEELLDETYAFGLERILDGLEQWREANRPDHRSGPGDQKGQSCGDGL